MPRFAFVSKDPVEVERYFSAMWTASQIVAPAASRRFDVSISGATAGPLGFTYASYGDRMSWLPQPQRNDFVITSCISGGALLREGDLRSEWTPGTLRAMSAHSELRIDALGALEMGSTMLSRQLLTDRLELWLGRKLDAELSLDQVTTPEFDFNWRQLQQTIRGMFLWSPPVVAGQAIGNYAADLIINLHGHTFTAALEALPAADDASVREALEFIRSSGWGPVSAGDVAHFARTPLAPLARAFREREGTTLTAALRQTRMQAAHVAIAAGERAQLPDIAAALEFPSVEALLAWHEAFFGERPAFAI